MVVASDTKRRSNANLHSNKPSNSQGRSSSTLQQTVQGNRASLSPPRVRQAGLNSSVPAAGCSPAIAAAAAAVDAASAAVAAALADAQFPSSAAATDADQGSSGDAAAAAATAEQRRTLLLHQQQQLAEAADRWMSLRSSTHSPGLPGRASAASGRLSGTGAAATSQQQQQYLRSVSPYASPAKSLRARSVSPIGSCTDAAVAAAAAFGGAARPRSRSLSPLGRLQQRASSCNSIRSAGSSPLFEHGRRSSSPCAAFAGVFQPPTAGLDPADAATAAGARHLSASYFADGTGSSAWQGLLGHDAAALTAAAAAAEADVAAGAAGSRCSSPAWRAAVAATYLSDLKLEQYTRFSRRMSQCSTWQQQLLAVQAARWASAASSSRR